MKEVEQTERLRMFLRVPGHLGIKDRLNLDYCNLLGIELFNCQTANHLSPSVWPCPPPWSLRSG